MNSQNQPNKAGYEGSPKPRQQKAQKREQKEPVAKSVKGQLGTPEQTRKAQANVTTIDQERDREQDNAC